MSSVLKDEAVERRKRTKAHIVVGFGPFSSQLQLVQPSCCCWVMLLRSLGSVALVNLLQSVCLWPSCVLVVSQVALRWSGYHALLG